MAKHFQTQLVRRFGGYTIAIITAHAPGLHMWPSPGRRVAADPTPSASK